MIDKEEIEYILKLYKKFFFQSIRKDHPLDPKISLTDYFRYMKRTLYA